MIANTVSRVIASATIGASFLLTACGEDGTTENVTNITQTGVDVVADMDNLPKCEKDNQGDLVFVKGESSARICVDGKWLATKESVKDTVVVAGDTVYMEGGDFSCTTKELKDKSGLKIICNGDSIGVVKNGEKGIQGEKGADGTNGTDGDDGASCAVAEQTDSTVVINCGGQSMTLNLGSVVNRDSLGLDSEKIATPLDTLAGVSQKGPFLKGSTVYLYELSDGRTLKQTNGNFVSSITSDDGRFRFTARDLMSQYALIMVDGKYRNEVTGKATNTAIRLQAYTDVLSRKNANVNLLTQLEMNRVYYLVTREKKRFKVAKHQAQMEIFDAFYIDTTKINMSSEDLNVFGSSYADAALLAISVLLQGSDDETALSVLLTEIADDMESDGQWNDLTTRAQVADRAFTLDLSQIRRNVEDWGLNKDAEIGNFEQIVENYIAHEFGVEACAEGDDDETRTVSNKLSAFDDSTYLCWSGTLSSRSEITSFNDEVNYGKMLDWRNRQVYRTVKIGELTWMAENLNYEYKLKPYGRDQYEAYGNRWYSDVGKFYGRYYTWAAAMDSASIFTENGRDCGYGRTCFRGGKYSVRGVCPVGWHLPDNSEWNALYFAMGNDPIAMQAKNQSNWSNATDAYGFSALPAGKYHSGYGFDDVHSVARFWSATEQEDRYAYQWSLSATYAGLGSVDKDKVFSSVRCVKDEP